MASKMSGSESDGDEIADHVASLKRLKEKDPDFYEFLQENDKDLLEFEDSEIEEEEEEDDEDNEKKVPKIVEEISIEKLDEIKQQLQSSPSIKLCKRLITFFQSAVQQTDISTGNVASMAHSDLFNDIVKLCVAHLVPALNKIIKKSPEVTKKVFDPTKSSQWKFIKPSIQRYLTHILKLFGIMSDSSAHILLLKHIINLIPYLIPFIKMSKHFVKKMILLWSNNEETVRVLSLIVIVRLTKHYEKEYLNIAMKSMYFAYIKNTKFTSPITWPLITFMKQSLAEVYSLNPELTYEHAFVYIRQLSIHLRNAITIKKKESYLTVYNWQYVHCILYWCHLLCRLQEYEAIKSLIYPLVQTTIGTINLIQTAKYVPLRFHLIDGLMKVSAKTGIFIPILPQILDVLKIVDFNKKSTFSVKPVNFSCALKVTKSQLQEAGFKDSCITEVCSLLTEYMASNAHSIGFPELALSAVVQIKAFCKQCRVSKYNQQLKSVLSKIEENSLFISEKRRLVNFTINDSDRVKKWEENMKEEALPLKSAKKSRPEVLDPPTAKRSIKETNASSKKKKFKRK